MEHNVQIISPYLRAAFVVKKFANNFSGHYIIAKPGTDNCRILPEKQEKRGEKWKKDVEVLLR